MQRRLTPEIDYGQAIEAIIAAMPAERKAQLYEYALFLQSREVADESRALIEADEALWEAQFAATPDRVFDALLAEARAEVEAGLTQPMFGLHGEFLPDQFADDDEAQITNQSAVS